MEEYVSQSISWRIEPSDLAHSTTMTLIVNLEVAEWAAEVKTFAAKPRYCTINFRDYLPSSSASFFFLHPDSSLLSSDIIGLRTPRTMMPGFNRSVVPLLRTSRLALRRSTVINPVQHVFEKDVYGVRGLATAFERSKPHVNIGMSYKTL